MVLAGLAIAGLLAIGTIARAADSFPHPPLPEVTRWPHYVFSVIAAMFVVAVVIGPILRKESPQNLPPVTHSHDEPPGTSGLHGRTGTRDPDAPDKPDA